MEFVTVTAMVNGGQMGLSDFDNMVNDMLKIGWMFYGNVTYTDDGNIVYGTVAMVRPTGEEMVVAN